MSNPAPKLPPPDQAQRQRALDPSNSILVQAPPAPAKPTSSPAAFSACSPRWRPAQIVAITFTKAAAAEMRHRILSELENAAAGSDQANGQGVALYSTASIDPKKMRPEPQEVSGHDFSRAENASKEIRALAPEGNPPDPISPAFSIEALAQEALHHSQLLGWNLLDQPAQLRISTIDSFCRDLALQQPLLSGLGDASASTASPTNFTAAPPAKP